MNELSVLTRLLRQVRRRTLTQLILDHGNVALCAALGGLILLMLTGTQVLDWYWPVLLLLVFFGIGMWRLRGRIPNEYQLAQTVDDRLGLHDSLSTALFFSQPVEARAHPDIVSAQRRQAEQAAADVDPVVASPLALPRMAYSTIALFAVAASLLALRYGLSGSLDLRQPLVHIPFDAFLSQPEVVAKNKAFPKQKMPDGLETVAVPADNLEQTGEKKNAMEDEAARSESIEADQPATKGANQAKSEKGTGQEGGEKTDASEKGEGNPGGDDRSQKDGSSSDKAGKQNSKSPGQGNNQSNSNQNENSNLMDKMRDAMANMLSRMRMSPQAQEGGQKNMSSNQGNSQAGATKQQQGKKGSPAPGKSQGEGQQQSDQEGEQQGEGASKNQMASNRTDGATDKQAAQEGKSGAGKQDGEKDIKTAEQQAAMGKISELLGKRAKDLTGEVMVEVSSGRQQLKTQYVQRNTGHADTGGEISRDEVPAAYQQFVQQYFEEIRKPAGGAKKAPAN